MCSPALAWVADAVMTSTSATMTTMDPRSMRIVISNRSGGGPLDLSTTGAGGVYNNEFAATTAGGSLSLAAWRQDAGGRALKTRTLERSCTCRFADGARQTGEGRCDVPAPVRCGG